MTGCKFCLVVCRDWSVFHKLGNPRKYRALLTGRVR